MVALLCRGDVQAQSPPTIDGPPAPVPPEVITRLATGQATVRAIKLTSPLKVDGRLDEDVYAREKPFGGLIQVAPRWERGVFGINMIVNVKKREDLSAFLDALQGTQSFYDVFASEQQAMEDGTYNATVAGGYVAPAGKVAKGGGARGGSQQP